MGTRESSVSADRGGEVWSPLEFWSKDHPRMTMRGKGKGVYTDVVDTNLHRWNSERSS